jgi:cytoskeletal protein RodZ
MIENVGVSVPRGGAVSIGEVLHDARSRLGLSIHEVARRTGIVEETIWAIELDDFSKCGEDFYARSYISIIAAVVRVDSAPLLAEFDAAHARHDAGEITQPLPLPTEAAPRRPEPPPPPRSDRYKWRHRRRVTLSTALCLIVLFIFGAEAYHFSRDAKSSTDTASQAAFNQATTKARPSAKSTAPAAKASPSAAASLSLRTLKPVSATAYGPSGPDVGNPQIAAKAIDASSATAWQSKAYTSSDFDGEQSGTGVLLDFGHPVTVVSADITVGIPGAWIELHGGTTDSPSALSVIGGTKDAGATTTIRPQQHPIRYLLIWFTTLPQTAVGNYQASIQNVTVQGHS